MTKRKISICCIQETKNIRTYDTLTSNGDKFIFLGRQLNGYGGLGFYVSKEWKDRVADSRLINERIAVIRLFRKQPETEAEAEGKRGDLLQFRKNRDCA